MYKTNTNVRNNRNRNTIKIEDLIVGFDKNTNCKANFNANLFDVPKNQKEFGHRNRIKP